MTEVAAREMLRRSALERTALATGKQWAERCRQELREQGRAISGGWPGTLSEARARVAAAWMRTGRRRPAAITHEELDWLARAAYARAKRDWLAAANREEP